jgi:hypothetical protein
MSRMQSQVGFVLKWMEHASNAFKCYGLEVHIFLHQGNNNLGSTDAILGQTWQQNRSICQLVYFCC